MNAWTSCLVVLTFVAMWPLLVVGYFDRQVQRRGRLLGVAGRMAALYLAAVRCALAVHWTPPCSGVRAATMASHSSAHSGQTTVRRTRHIV